MCYLRLIFIITTAIIYGTAFSEEHKRLEALNNAFRIAKDNQQKMTRKECLGIMGAPDMQNLVRKKGDADIYFTIDNGIIGELRFYYNKNDEFIEIGSNVFGVNDNVFQKYKWESGKYNEITIHRIDKVNNIEKGAFPVMERESKKVLVVTEPIAAITKYSISFHQTEDGLYNVKLSHPLRIGNEESHKFENLDKDKLVVLYAGRAISKEVSSFVIENEEVKMEYKTNMSLDDLVLWYRVLTLSKE